MTALTILGGLQIWIASMLVLLALLGVVLWQGRNDQS